MAGRPGTRAYGALFLSYRREDAAHVAGRLFDRLSARWGTTAVFMDVDSLPGGADVRAAIAEAVRSSNLMLVLIGRNWNPRRLFNADDFVGMEIWHALQVGIPVIPVLVDGATLPNIRELPPQLVGLLNRNAMFLDHFRFATEADAIADTVAGYLGPARPRTEPLPQITARPRSGPAPRPQPPPRSRRALVIGSAATGAAALVGSAFWFATDRGAASSANGTGQLEATGTTVAPDIDSNPTTTQARPTDTAPRTTPDRTPTTTTTTTEPPEPPPPEPLTTTAAIAVGGGRIFAAEKVVVTQPQEGVFQAFSAICTHQGCTVGSVEGTAIVCPCHGSFFSIVDGTVLSGPAPQVLPGVDIEVRDGSIFLV